MLVASNYRETADTIGVNLEQILGVPKPTPALLSFPPSPLLYPFSPLPSSSPFSPSPGDLRGKALQKKIWIAKCKQVSFSKSQIKKIWTFSRTGFHDCNFLNGQCGKAREPGAAMTPVRTLGYLLSLSLQTIYEKLTSKMMYLDWFTYEIFKHFIINW